MNKTILALLLAMVLASPAFAKAKHSGTASHGRHHHTLNASRPTAVPAPDPEKKPQPTAEAVPPAQDADSVKQLVTAVAEEHGVPPALAHAIVQVESRYDCAAKNRHSTATGLMQTLKGTARSVGVTGDLRDCRNGLEAGMRYLKQAVEEHGASCAAASAYNTGISRARRCTAYGRKVMALMDHPAARSREAKL